MDTKTIDKKSEWEGFIAKHPEANFLHSWYWGEFQKQIEREVIRIGFYSNSKLVGVMLTIVEPAKRARYLIVPGGPIIDWNNKGLVIAFGKELRNLGKIYNCVFARLRPQLEDNDLSRKTFRKLGFSRAPMYLHAELTSQLDIRKTEEELLRNMRKATRHEIKKALTLGIKIEQNGDRNIVEFYKLQIDTAKRQKFVPFSKDFLETQFEIFIKNDKAILYTAKYKRKILAQAFIIFYGAEAVYHYGASTEFGRKYPGAYLIQWEAIREAKKRNMSRYNFWGVSPIDSNDHRFKGLSLFKRGFGGQDVAYLPAQDLVFNRPRYLINYLIEKSRRALRRA
ncbi:MAG: peptidoglycan bridge formation glycyltransferase FemA/FemB family protein [Candidatus Levybacteria bacterium]|nr:peptidoglycan bridge formation glycyltransferase FemA/FemB family protein [Candidatus Levybacteria bacterium]